MNTNVTTNATKWCDELKFNRFHASVLIISSLVFLFDGYASTVIFFLIPHFMKEWALTPLQASSAPSATFGGMMVGAILFGMLGDLIGRKKSLLLTIFLFSLGTGFTYWSPNFSTFCILRFFAGLGIGGSGPLVVTLVAEFSPARVRGKSISSMFVGFNIGPIMGGILGMALLPHYTWRSLFLVEFLALILVPAVCLCLPESVRFLTSKGKNEAAVRVLRKLEKAAGKAPVDWTPESLAVPPSARVGIGEVFRSDLGIMTVLLWCVNFLALLAFFGAQTWLPQMLMKAGHTMVKSYSFSLAFPVGGIIGMLFIGGVGDRFGRKQALVPSLVLGGIATWMFGAFTSDAGIYVMGFLISFFVGGCSFPTLNVVMGETYPTQFRASGIAWAGSIGRLGSMVGPLLGGAVQMAGLSFSQFFVVFAVPLFLAAVGVLFFRVNVRRESLETVTEKLTATVKKPAPSASGSAP